jgi:Na+-driven multidrug efflux pump
VAVFGAGTLLKLLNAPEDVMRLAHPFLQCLALALLLDAWNACMASVMRAHLRNQETLWITVIMHATHLLLALPLMRGGWFFPEMGLPGFAVALIHGLGLDAATFFATQACLAHRTAWSC